MKKVLNLSVFVSCLVGMFICLAIVVACLGYAINSFVESGRGLHAPTVRHEIPNRPLNGHIREHIPNWIER